MSAARRRAEDSLQRTHQELEARVHERTADLERSNERLRAAAADAATVEAERHWHVWILESLDCSSRSMCARARPSSWSLSKHRNLPPSPGILGAGGAVT